MNFIRRNDLSDIRDVLSLYTRKWVPKQNRSQSASRIHLSWSKWHSFFMLTLSRAHKLWESDNLWIYCLQIIRHTLKTRKRKEVWKWLHNMARGGGQWCQGMYFNYNMFSSLLSLLPLVHLTTRVKCQPPFSSIRKWKIVMTLPLPGCCNDKSWKSHWCPHIK